MIHARDDYNRIQDPENKIPNDEPVFLFRGQDRHAPQVLRYYASLVRLDSEADQRIARLTETWAKEMEKWQGQTVKSPDL